MSEIKTVEIKNQLAIMDSNDLLEVIGICESIISDRNDKKRIADTETVNAILLQYGLAPVSLKEEKSKRKGVKRSGEAKYQSKKDASLIWTGKGRKPKWVELHIANGGTIEDLLITKK